MRLTPSLLLLGAAVGAAPACVIELGDYSGPKVQKEVELSHAAGASVKEFFVDAYNGDVTIEVGPAGSVSGTSRLHARGRTEEVAQTRLDSMTWSFHEEGDRLIARLSEPNSGGKNNCGGTASLHVPAGLRIFVDSSNGAVEVTGDFPYAWVDSSNGGITTTGVREVELDTSNGPVIIADADGKVVADTSNGGITYAGASQDFHLDTSNGGIEVRLTGDWSGKGYADTSNGNVTVNCAGVLDCTVSAHASNGKVYTPTLAGGRGKLQLDTSNGDVTIEQGSAQ